MANIWKLLVGVIGIGGNSVSLSRKELDGELERVCSWLCRCLAAVAAR